MQYLVSLLFGIAVGVAYGMSSVKSPAPPMVALVGLLGIVIGEHAATWLRTPVPDDPAVTRDASPPPSRPPTGRDR